MNTLTTRSLALSLLALPLFAQQGDAKQADQTPTVEQIVADANRVSYYQGKDGRAHNGLGWAMLEYRPMVSDTIGIPLRFAPGYLPKNGPLLRSSAGVSFQLADGVDMVLDLITPTVWVTHDQTVLSFDASAELGFDL